MKKILFVLFVFITFSCNVFAKSYEDVELNDINLSLKIPSKYYVFTRDIDSNDYLLEKFDMTEEYISNYMNALNAYMIAINESSTEGIYITRKSDSTTKEYNDLNNLPTSTLNALADGYRIGFGAEHYEIYEYNTKKYITFEYEYEDIYENYYYVLKYKTIVDGYDYTFYLQKNTPITQNDKSTMTDVIESIDYNERSSFNSIITGITLLLFGGFVAMFFIKPKKK